MPEGVLHRHLTALGLEHTAMLNHLLHPVSLWREGGVFSLRYGEHSQAVLQVDFLSAAMQYRSQQHLGDESLIKACRNKGGNQLTVLDATCGLGTDSFLLHQAGFTVIATEHHPVTHALLTDGLKRWSQQSGEPGFELHLAHAADWMQRQSYDVIYLDPMFPSSGKSAKSKKAMQLFKILHHGALDNAAELLQLARRSSAKRVVIKRPSKSPLLTPHKPTFQIKGKTCRFDVYQN